MPIKFRWIFFWVFFISACIDPINLTLDDKTEFLVVDGTFSTNKNAHQLKLYYAIGQRVKAQRPVGNAQIILVENNTNRFGFEEVEEGLYELYSNEIIGKVGETYHIEIKLATGKTYQSLPEVMPQKIKGDSVFFDYSYRDIETQVGSIPRPFVEAFVATPLPPKVNPYWLKWETNTMYSFPEVVCSPFVPPKICYVPGDNKQQEINLLNGANIEADYLPKWKVGKKLIPPNDFEFRGRHYFLINQVSITKGAFDYWSKINLIANQTGSIFDVPPAAVPGNIYNLDDSSEEVLGYFELSNIDSLRAFVTEGDFNDFYKFTTNTCEDVANPFATNTNSSLNRPEWW